MRRIDAPSCDWLVELDGFVEIEIMSVGIGMRSAVIEMRSAKTETRSAFFGYANETSLTFLAFFGLQNFGAET